MKVKVGPLWAVFGPVGHPLAAVQAIGLVREDLESKVHAHLSRFCVQGIIPSIFFDEDLSLEAQGFHTLLVHGDEIDDAAIAALPIPRWFKRPASLSEPGRKISDFKHLLPSYNNPEQVEVWHEGQLPEGSPVPCDHDFGLESYKLIFRHESGQLFDEEESFNFQEGEYFNTLTCSRCGAIHAMRQD